MRRLSLLFGLGLPVLLSFASVTTVSGAELPRPKRVLIISTGSRLSPGFTLMDRAIIEALGNNLSNPVDTYAENLDILRFPSGRFRRIFGGYLTEKYAEQPPDLIVLIFVGNLAVAGTLLHEIFPGTPVVVAGATEEEVRADQFRSPLSGVAARVNSRATLELIFRLQPETRHVVVVGGTAEVDRQVLDRVKEAARSFEGPAKFDFWDNRSMAELRQAVATLPSQTVILFSRTFRDGSGQAVISTQVGQSISEWANVPVYAMTGTALGTGAVGGSVNDVYSIGKRAGEMARLILNGTPPASLPLETDTGNVPTFDWRALKRWGISESRLPPNSVVRFRPESVWEQYRWYILGGLIIILAQSAIIADLFLQRRRLSQVKTKLQESQQLMELAVSAGELGLGSRDLRNGDVWANAAMRSLFGFGPTDPLRFDDMLARVHPDDQARMHSEIERADAVGQPFQGEFRTVLPGGAERWVLAKGRTVVEPGRHNGRRMGILLDITERKRAEEALRETEDRLARTEEFSLVMVTHTDLEGRWLKVPPTLCKLLGYTERELLGRRFHELTHPDDLKGNVDQRLRLLRGEIKSFDIEKRYIRKDGGIIWVYVNVSVVTDAKDNPIHCLSYIRDITERKQAEEALRESEGLRRAIFESEPECVKLMAPDYRLLDMNPAGLAMIEADCVDQVIGQSVMALIAPEWRATYEDLHRRVCREKAESRSLKSSDLKGNAVGWSHMLRHCEPRTGVSSRSSPSRTTSPTVSERNRI